MRYLKNWDWITTHFDVEEEKFKEIEERVEDVGVKSCDVDNLG